MSADATRIETLRLVNYRRFENTFIEFDPVLTVLVSPNGGGKTALLDGLAAAWSVFVEALQPRIRHSPRLFREDVRLAPCPQRTMEPVLPARVQAAGLVLGERKSWTHEVRAVHHRRGEGAGLHWQAPPWATSGLFWHVGVAGELSEAITLPLICYYGAGRRWGTQKPKPGKKTEPEDPHRLAGYTGCLAPAADFRFFERWFLGRSRDAASGLRDRDIWPDGLPVVRAVVDRALAPSGWKDLEWDFVEDTLSVSHDRHGRLPVRLLGEADRQLIGLYGDIAHRAVRLNPHLGAGAPAMTPGIVMIDDVDTYLHPAWQQTIVASLTEAFPRVQLVLTTRSPLVISTVPSRSVRILRDDGSVCLPSVETRGDDSSFVLGAIFGVNTSPPLEITRHLTRYRLLLEHEQGDSEEAQSLRRLLLDHFGARHPVMLEVDGLRRLQEFKARIARAVHV